jgi:fatty-acyl-CoA synthase
VGSALPHVEIKIIDEHGKVVPRGTPGEFCARGYLVMKKYWNDPGQTKEAIDDSGFIRSGDLAIMDEEGYVLHNDIIIRFQSVVEKRI